MSVESAFAESRSGVVAEADLFQFFLGRVETAVAHQRADVSPNAVYYLTQLLAEQGRAEDGAGTTTLVELRQRAVTAPPGEAVHAWKKMGDHSLLVTGYFREEIERRRLSVSYYASMGRAAYDVVSRLLQGPRGGLGEVFGELAGHWESCAEVIGEVRDEARTRRDTDIVKLYEEWLATGSPRVADRLRELGVIPARVQGSS